MYVDRIEIRHLKLLEDFKLSFRNPDGSPRMWTVIIGKNGTAKSSILQAIALAAAGQLQVNTLAKPIVGHLRDRRGKAAMQVRVEFRFETEASTPKHHPLLGRGRAGTLQADERVRSEIELANGSMTLTGRSVYVDANGRETPTNADPLVEARMANRAGWFVAGFGISRFLPDPAQNPTLENPGIDRMDPLFRHTSGLTSLRFVNLFEGKRAQQFSKLLRDTLVTVRELVPGLKGIELRGAGGVSKAGQLIDKDRFQLDVGNKQTKLPAVALSHGYQSIIAWIADLIGHMMLELGPVPARAMAGTVLIDEIDLYLHPEWQAGLVGALRKTFPNVQFIATTHSPVVLSGLAPHEIVRVAQDPVTGSVARWSHDASTGALVPVTDDSIATAEPDPRMMTGTEIYRDWFAVDRLLLNPAGQDLREWYRIASNPYRDDRDDTKLSALRERLREEGIDPPIEPVPRMEPPT